MTAQIDSSACPTPFWLSNGHAQTIHGALAARHHRIGFVRERVNTPDTDFIDFDWAGPGLFSDKAPDNTISTPDPRLRRTAARRWMTAQDWDHAPTTSEAPALIVFHGLEGSSKSHYAQAIAQYFRARGWMVVIAHFRSCSGFPNRMARAYYSGDTDDIGFMFDTVRTRLPNARWHAVGVSMGGNVLLKYLGETPDAHQWLHAAAAVSSPMDLVACGNRLSDSFLGRHVYGRYFLKTMRRKLQEKARRFPGTIDLLSLNHVRTLRDFDDLYTAPMHGYRNALDYWTRASSKPLLSRIEVPTLLLNARNDPFVPAASLPRSHECSEAVLLHQPEHGGHMGFVTGQFPGHLNWLPERLGRYFDTRQ